MGPKIKLQKCSDLPIFFQIFKITLDWVMPRLYFLPVFNFLTLKINCSTPDMAQNFENFWKVKILDILILILILKTAVSKYWFWYWYWNLHFQNIDFDIDIELFGNFDIDIGIDIEKNGVNIENFSSERG